MLERIFKYCESVGASDIHLAPGVVPHFRVKGALAPVSQFAVGTAADLFALSGELLSRAGCGAVDLSAVLSRRGSFDGACTSPAGWRYRFNIFRCQAADASTAPKARLPLLGVSLRRLEDRFRSLAELGLPETLARFTKLNDGLVIVSGPTGSGKSTTLATLIDRINRTRDGHIITIEDPVEYVHRSQRCLVNQRQVGTDTTDFNTALVDSLREDPDVILVGEIRELETIRTAITAAETGHLVFTTLHAGDCIGAVERLVSVFPAAEQESIRRQLSLVLRGVVAQRLIPSERPAAARRRFPVVEVLINTPAVANLVATGKSAQLYSAIETGTAFGMRTLEHDLARAVAAGEISATTAQGYSRQPDILKNRIATLLSAGGRESTL